MLTLKILGIKQLISNLFETSWIFDRQFCPETSSNMNVLYPHLLFASHFVIKLIMDSVFDSIF